jgi:hypothetical protein
MKFLLITIFIFLKLMLFAQLNFQFSWGNENVENNKRYYFSQEDWIEFSELKIYLSNYSVIAKKQGHLMKIVDLIDNENADSKVILDSTNINLYETLTFNFGLDSLINTSGILDGDLDPVNGMYWAWNSGYIHLKMVGKSSLVNTAKNEFEFHLGGYRSPNQTCFLVTVPIKGDLLKFDLKPLFTNQIELKKSNNLMIPGKEAHQISKFAATLFSTE